MKKIKVLILLVFNCLLASSIVSAQKLPTVQQISLRAPKNIKIDGKTTEWNNQFQALNHNIHAYYTIANDADNLYLIVQPKDATIAKKAIVGGIVLTINHTKNMEDQHSIIIGSPLIPESAMIGIMRRYSDFKEYVNNKASAKQIDSLLAIANNELAAASKELALVGIKEIDNNTISVYNEYGIKAALLFDRSGALNYEVAIPLKYLHIPTNSQPDFYYDVMIKGMVNRSKIINTPTGSVMVTNVPRGMAANNSSNMDVIMSNTDFWGQYTLAR